MTPQDWIAAGPIGVAALFLVYLFRLFVKSSEKNRDDEQAFTVRTVAEAIAERDYARAETKAAEAALDAHRTQCTKELQELRTFYEDLIDRTKKELKDEWQTTRIFLYKRIAHLEKLLYGQVQTPPPPDVDPEASPDP